MLCGHKKLSNIEESGRGTGGELESLIFFYFCLNLWPGLSENEKKVTFFLLVLMSGTLKHVLKHRSMKKDNDSEKKEPFY